MGWTIPLRPNEWDCECSHWDLDVQIPDLDAQIPDLDVQITDNPTQLDCGRAVVGLCGLTIPPHLEPRHRTCNEDKKGEGQGGGRREKRGGRTEARLEAGCPRRDERREGRGRGEGERADNER